MNRTGMHNSKDQHDHKHKQGIENVYESLVRDEEAVVAYSICQLNSVQEGLRAGLLPCAYSMRRKTQRIQIRTLPAYIDRRLVRHNSEVSKLLAVGTRCRRAWKTPATTTKHEKKTICTTKPPIMTFSPVCIASKVPEDIIPPPVYYQSAASA
jgi:hypothetical protein